MNEWMEWMNGMNRMEWNGMEWMNEWMDEWMNGMNRMNGMK